MTEHLEAKVAARERGGTSLASHLTLFGDGSLMVKNADSGAVVEAFFGGGDYEFWVDLKPEAALRLMECFAADRFGAGPDRPAAEAAYCAERGLPAPGADGSSRLAFLWEVTKERLAGDLSAVKTVREYCEARELPFKFMTWYSPDRD